LKRYLGSIQEKLKSAGCTGVKWVVVGGIHLTLKFLGNVPAQKVSRIKETVGLTCSGEKPFVLSTGGLGVFPGMKQPRVLWIAVNGDIERLVRLQRRIDEQLLSLGFEQEKRPFSPHITLARTRETITEAEQSLLGRLAKETVLNESFRLSVQNISLMRSQLLPGGAVYTRLAVSVLS
jgi:2'-5' RNA ligase